MGKIIICDKCNTVITALDTGFDPATLNMKCDCGGNWTHKTMKDCRDDSRLPWTLQPDGSLRLHSVNNSSIVEFRRTTEGAIQRRALCPPDGTPFIDTGSPWEDVTKGDMVRHIQMGGPVAEWLSLRGFDINPETAARDTEDRVVDLSGKIVDLETTVRDKLASYECSKCQTPVFPDKDSKCPKCGHTKARERK